VCLVLGGGGSRGRGGGGVLWDAGGLGGVGGGGGGGFCGGVRGGASWSLSQAYSGTGKNDLSTKRGGEEGILGGMFQKVKKEKV